MTCYGDRPRAHADRPRRLATETGYRPKPITLRSRPLLSNDRMQQTAPRGGRAANGGVDAATACSLSLASAPLLIPVLDGQYETAVLCLTTTGAGGLDRDGSPVAVARRLPRAQE